MSDPYSLDDNFTRAMIAFAAGDYDESARILSAILDDNATHTLALSARGAARMKAGDLEAAVADFDRALQIDPDYVKARHLRGLARENQGDDAGALADFDRAVEQAPGYGAAYYSRASLNARMGRAEKAAEDFETIAHLTRFNAETFGNENNVWRSDHLRVEEALETEIDR